MNKENYSPMIQHYLQLKEQNPDSILMYRLGDFYEMFFDDAITVSRELDLVLTARAGGAEKVPMCGVPYHAADNYIGRLIRRGYKVAVCEQLSDPKASKGLVERGIIKIITPGTWMEKEGSAASTYLAILESDSFKSVLLLCDLSTGQLLYWPFRKSVSQTLRLLEGLGVAEIVCSSRLDKTTQKALGESESWTLSFCSGRDLSPQEEELLSESNELLKNALGILMNYLDKTTMQHADHLQKTRLLYPADAMILDPETRSHLELTTTSSASSKAQSLWQFMDKCKSAMGSRMLKSWIEAPLMNEEEILQRQNAVEQLMNDFLLLESLQTELTGIYDMERLAARISYRSASPRDLFQLRTSLEHARPVLELARQLESYPFFQSVDACDDLTALLHAAICEDPPLTMKDGNVIATGFDEHLDEIRHLADESSQALLELEEKEKERTGIKGLKIGYNRVFGYFIEVRNSQLGMVKDEFGWVIRQNLANSVRYISQELKELESKILHAQEEKVELENRLFSQILEEIKKRLPDLQHLSSALALADVLASLAALALQNNYVRPQFSKDGSIVIEEGRHPIMERKLKNYVSNSWKMDAGTSAQIITGPNMGGKSTWLRQNALLCILAQMGSFVPARKATLPVFDRIFTRIGASDDLMAGKSTFMMEMSEANKALKNATDKSLILFDEIGRGTATYDGMALAQSMLEYLVTAIQAKTLFSTHYHELTDLEQTHPEIQNIHVDVKEEKKTIEFRYRMIEGKADKSYGLNVARLAGLPRMVTDRAETLLKEYESQQVENSWQPGLFVMDPTEQKRIQLVDAIMDLDLDSMSARDALNCLYDLKKEAEKIS